MIDARISIALPSHPKTKKLIKISGTDAAWSLVCLFLWAAQNRPDGVLSGMDAEAIELAVDWPGEDGAFVASLIRVGFLDNDDGEFVIHDWHEHNPWAAGADDFDCQFFQCHGEANHPDGLCGDIGRGVTPIYDGVQVASMRALDASRNRCDGCGGYVADEAMLYEVASN